MTDQAHHLRDLMRTAPAAPPAAARPRFLAVVGAKGGVGATTMAVNLAVALAGKDERTALVDGDLGKADAAALCGLGDGPTIVDVMARRRGIDESLQPGPGGLRVLAGAWATGHLTDCDPATQQRLLDGLEQLSELDLVVIDAGSGLNRVMARFWAAADGVLLVATPDDAAVMNAYATLKTMLRQNSQVPVHLLINRAARYDEARHARTRLALACRRFLAFDLPCVAHMTASRDVATAARRAAPFILTAPVCQATQTIQQVAQYVAAVIPSRSVSEDERAIPSPSRSNRDGVGRPSPSRVEPRKEKTMERFKTWTRYTRY